MEEDRPKSAPENSEESAQPPDPEPVQPAASPALAREEVKERVKEKLAAAHQKLARAEPAFERTRQGLQRSEETLQYNQARRERAAEQRALRAASGIGLAETAAQQPEPLEILLIEDNPGESSLFQESLTEGEIPCRVSLLTDGSQVLAFLHRGGPCAQIPQPQLIVLDLTIPGMSAEEVLAALRTVPAYQTVPVIVFSSGNEADGQQHSLQLGAQAFVQKPLD